MKLDLPLKEMTTEEKLEAMEAIWSALCETPEDIPSPDWHENVLQEREREASAGNLRFAPLAEVKERLLRLKP